MGKVDSTSIGKSLRHLARWFGNQRQDPFEESLFSPLGSAEEPHLPTSAKTRPSHPNQRIRSEVRLVSKASRLILDARPGCVSALLPKKCSYCLRCSHMQSPAPFAPMRTAPSDRTYSHLVGRSFAWVRASPRAISRCDQCSCLSSHSRALLNPSKSAVNLCCAVCGEHDVFVDSVKLANNVADCGRCRFRPTLLFTLPE